MMMRSPIIEIQDVWFSYNDHPILKDVNLSVHPKDFLALIGPNGGGKTTLLKLMLGLLKPHRGSIRVFGKAPQKASSLIGYVPQETGVNKSFPISVSDVVLMGRLRHGKNWGRFSADDRKAACEALERVGMWEFGTRRIAELSVGQRQRVLIARALVASPEILFLDEPTASVDVKGQTDLYDFLKQLNEHVTIVVVSHDLMVLSSYVKSVACVNQQVFYHDAAEITNGMLSMAYACPVELIAHGLPHRVLPKHRER